MHRRLGRYTDDTAAVVREIEELGGTDRRRFYIAITRGDANQAKNLLWGIENVEDGNGIAANLLQKRSEGELGIPRPSKTFGNLHTLRLAEVNIDTETISRLSLSAGNVRGASYELHVVNEYLERGENVVAVGRDIGRTEIDILIEHEDGDVMIVETKNIVWSANRDRKVKEIKENIGRKLPRIVDEYGQGTEIVVEFGGPDPLPNEIRGYIDRKKSEGFNIRIGYR